MLKSIVLYSPNVTFNNYTRSNPKSERKPTRKSSKKLDVSKSQKGLIKGNFSLISSVFSTKLPNSITHELPGYVELMVDAHNSYIKNLGIKFGTKYWKEISQYCINLCEGKECSKVNRLSLGLKDFWPNKLGKLRPLYHMIVDKDNIHSDAHKAEGFRLLITLFKLNKVCEDFDELAVDDLSSAYIVPKSTVVEFKEFLEINYPMNDNSRSLNRNSMRLTGLSFGSSNGPNGLPKTESAFMEAQALISSVLWNPFKEFCELTDNKPFLTYLEAYASDVKISENERNTKKNKTTVFLRKLISIADAGNKSRVIALCDFWTQSLLSELERFCVKFLLENFKGKTALKSHSKGWDDCLKRSNDTWISLDATAWTDNFPASLQVVFLKHMFGESLATCWKKLAVSCDWNLGSTNHIIKYGKGQGMGTKGSFAIASVTDHLFIEFMMRKHYGKILPYMKVGDDLVISDPDKVFKGFYEDIGVPINMSKSKSKTSRGHFMEFVSRNSWNGMDISIISPQLLRKTTKQPFYVPVLLGHIKERASIDTSFIRGIVEVIHDRKPMEKSKLNNLLGIYELLTETSFTEDGPLGYTFSQEKEKFLLLEIVRTFNSKFKTYVESLEPTGDMDVIDMRYHELCQFVGNSFDFHRENGYGLCVIKLHQFLDELNRQVGDSIESYTNLNALTPGVGAMSKGELELSSKLLSQIAMMDSHINDIKIINRLNLLSHENSRTIVELFKDINKLYVKVDKLEYYPVYIPNTCPQTFLLVQNLNANFGLRRDPAEMATPL
jgi:hypothetical protein